MVLTKGYFLDKAAQCRGLASVIANQADPGVAALHAMARQFEARAYRVADEEVDGKIDAEPSRVD